MFPDTLVGIRCVVEKALDKSRWIIDFGIQGQGFLVIGNGLLELFQMAVRNGAIHISLGKTGIDVNGPMIIHKSFLILVSWH